MLRIMNAKTAACLAVVLGTCLSASARVVPPVPEPAGYVAGALLLGILGIAVVRHRKK
jgi:hypothetical protein